MDESKFEQYQNMLFDKMFVSKKNTASIKWLETHQYNNMIYVDWDNEYQNVPFYKGNIYSITALINYLELQANSNCAIVQADNYRVYLRYYENGNDYDLFSFYLVKRNNL